MSNVQLAMTLEPSTVVPQPKAPARKDVIVQPKETVITAVPSPGQSSGYGPSKTGPYTHHALDDAVYCGY